MMETPTFKGSWFDLGWQEGKAHAAIAKYTAYANLWYTGAGYIHTGSTQDAGLLRRVTALVEAFLAAQFKEDWDKLLGISQGSGIEMELLLAANFPQLVAALASRPDLPSAEGGSLLISPDGGSGALLGATFDHYENPLCFVTRVQPDAGFPICYATRPGLGSRILGGINARGLAIFGTNATAMSCTDPARKSYAAGDRPYRAGDSRILGRDMLACENVVLRSCATVDEALRRMAQPDLFAGRNYVLLDATGNGALVEGYAANSGCELRITPLKNTPLACGNFRSGDIRPEDYARHPDKADAFQRYMSLHRSIDQARGPFSLDALKAALTAHDGDPQRFESVCNVGTGLAVIACSTLATLHVAMQPPCVSPFVLYGFEAESANINAQ